ncbi:immunity 49 family protein [Streptomyces sp. NPDC013181]|uniref:immunity 49 family protein n=1 Tax=Streptomyces sp. NPDC013181 TaxID=3364864 RepID=UPI00367C7FC6
MVRIERHVVGAEAAAAALDGFGARIGGLVRAMSAERMTGADWSLLAGEFLDHLGAMSLRNPGLDTPQAKAVLDAASQAATGAVSCAAYFPGLPFSVSLDYVNFGMGYDGGADADASPAEISSFDWIDAFCLAVLTGTVERHREAFHHTRQPPHGEEAGLPVHAFVHGLMAYVLGDLWDDDAEYPPAEADVLAAIDDGIGRIRALGEAREHDFQRHSHTTALLALRALAAGDREAFDRALGQLLLAHKTFAEAVARSRPRSLLPLEPLALTALAHQRRGWQPAVGTDYLPRALVTGFEPTRPQESRADMVAALRAGAALYDRPDE